MFKLVIFPLSLPSSFSFFLLSLSLSLSPRQTTPVNHMSAYTDTSGLFDVTFKLEQDEDEEEEKEKAKKEEELPIVTPPAKRPHTLESVLDDEDELLYGPTGVKPEKEQKKFVHINFKK